MRNLLSVLFISVFSVAPVLAIGGTDFNTSPYPVVVPYAPNTGQVNAVGGYPMVPFVPGVQLLQGVPGGTPIAVWSLPAAGLLDANGHVADPASDVLVQRLAESNYLQNQEQSIRTMMNEESSSSGNAGFELR